MSSKLTRSIVLSSLVCLMSLGLASSEAVAQVDLFVTPASGDVQRYDGTTGASLGVFTSGGPGGLGRGLVVGPDLNLVVAAPGGPGAQKFNGLSGVYISTLIASGAGGITSASGIDLGSDGNFYLCTRANGVARFDATGAFIDYFASGGGLDAMTSVFGPDGNLYVTSLLTDEVRRYNGATGAFIDNFVSAGSGGLLRPAGLAFGPDGNLYVSSQANDVKRYNGATGAHIDNFASTGLSNPNGIAFGVDGNLYVANTGGDNVRRYNGATGSLIDIFATGVNNPVYLLFYEPQLPTNVESSSWSGIKNEFTPTDQQEQ